VEKPRSVRSALDIASLAQAAQRGRNRGAPHGDQPPQQLVCQGHRHVHTVALHPTPAVGQVPEQHEHTDVDPRKAADRQLHREPASPLDGAPRHPAENLGPARGRRREPRVKHGDGGRLEHRPIDRGGNRRIGPVLVPRAPRSAGSRTTTRSRAPACAPARWCRAAPPRAARRPALSQAPDRSRADERRIRREGEGAFSPLVVVRPPNVSARADSTAGACGAPTIRAPPRSSARCRGAARSPCTYSRGRCAGAPPARAG
jgi:hypothetical protein